MKNNYTEKDIPSTTYMRTPFYDSWIEALCDLIFLLIHHSSDVSIEQLAIDWLLLDFVLQLSLEGRSIWSHSLPPIGSISSIRIPPVHLHNIQDLHFIQLGHIQPPNFVSQFIQWNLCNGSHLDSIYPWWKFILWDNIHLEINLIQLQQFHPLNNNPTHFSQHSSIGF